MSKTRKSRRSAQTPRADADRRRQWVTAAWAFGIIAAVAVAGVVTQIVTSKPEPKPLTSTLPAPTVASCTGESPFTPLRDRGPFAPPPRNAIDLDHIYVATVKTYCGDLAFKIDPRDAPEAARSFIFLAQKRYFDGLAFDRLVSGLGAFAADADPGYKLEAGHGKAFGGGDLVMVDVDADTTIHIAARFAILTETVKHGLAAVRVGVPLEGSTAANQTTIGRIMRQPVTGTTPDQTIYIVHVDIQEFTRG